jgi:hypothetical protein
MSAKPMGIVRINQMAAIFGTLAPDFRYVHRPACIPPGILVLAGFSPGGGREGEQADWRKRGDGCQGIAQVKMPDRTISSCRIRTSFMALKRIPDEFALRGCGSATKGGNDA